MAITIQLRRDTADDWVSVNPILAAGECGFESDTYRLKIGDGTSNWNNLEYFMGINTDSALGDAFSRLRVSNPAGVFDGQMTYDLQPLLFEQITAETGASIAHSATDRLATLTFASTPTGGVARMQSF